MTSTHTKIDSKGINHSPSSVHFTAVLKSPEQLGPPRCIGPVYPRLRVLSALPFHGQFARREENPTGHLRYVSTRSEKHINTNMSSTGRQKLIWAHLSWESLYCKICKCHRYLPVQQKLLFNAPLVLNSLKSVHETLSQERQKLQAVWDANNMHQSNTLAQVRFVIWTLCPTLSCLVFYTWWLIFFVHSFFFLPLVPAWGSEAFIPRTSFSGRLCCRIFWCQWWHPVGQLLWGVWWIRTKWRKHHQFWAGGRTQWVHQYQWPGFKVYKKSVGFFYILKKIALMYLNSIAE